MNKTYFEIIRSGINSTFQDLGRENLYHIGIPFSGAMDKRNFLISNALTGNKKDTAALEFAYQGPLMKLKNGKINFAITGDVNFNIIRNSSKIEKGNCYQTYNLEHDEQIDIISTNKSVYGYFSIKGEFDIKPFWGSCSINTKAKIGPNDGNKISKNQKIYLNNVEGNFNTKKLNYINSKIEYIRVIKGTNFNYFSENAKKFFFNEKFTISKLSDRMGMRLEGKKIENIVDTNIKSEGLIRELIRHVQVMRKEADFNVDDRIILSGKFSSEISGAIDNHKEYFMNEILCTDIVDSLENSDYNSVFKHNSEEFDVLIKKKI